MAHIRKLKLEQQEPH